eukprot:scaffold2.g7334.t1
MGGDSWARRVLRRLTGSGKKDGGGKQASAPPAGEDKDKRKKKVVANIARLPTRLYADGAVARGVAAEGLYGLVRLTVHEAQLDPTPPGAASPAAAGDGGKGRGKKGGKKEGGGKFFAVLSVGRQTFASKKVKAAGEARSGASVAQVAIYRVGRVKGAFGDTLQARQLDFAAGLLRWGADSSTQELGEGCESSGSEQEEGGEREGAGASAGAPAAGPSPPAAAAEAAAAGGQPAGAPQRAASCSDGGEVLRDAWLPLVDPGDAGRARGRVRVSVRASSPQDLEQQLWRRLLALADLDGDGCLENGEFGMMMEAIGADLSPEEAQELFARADANGDGAVDASELAVLLTRCHDDGEFSRLMKRCPVDGAELLPNHDLANIIYVSLALDDGTGECLRGGYTTPEQASRSWLLNLTEWATQPLGGAPGAIFRGNRYVAGGLRRGAAAAHILVFDRASKRMVEEALSPSLALAMRAIYQSSAGRLLLREGALKQMRKMTEKYGQYADSPESAKEIGRFLAAFKGQVDMQASRVRARAHERASARARLMVYSTVDDATRCWIKGRRFSVAGLLGDAGEGGAAAAFAGGAMAIFRLAPQDYHRRGQGFHLPVGGTVESIKDVAGELMTVNPIGVNSFFADAFTRNQRSIMMLSCPGFGRVAYVAIGATVVGSIRWTLRVGAAAARGDEAGYFAFGGSTVVVLFQAGAVAWDDDLAKNRWGRGGGEERRRGGRLRGARAPRPGALFSAKISMPDELRFSAYPVPPEELQAFMLPSSKRSLTLEGPWQVQGGFSGKYQGCTFALAKPAQIRQMLGIAELSVAQVKSHLQKYRVRTLAAAMENAEGATLQHATPAQQRAAEAWRARVAAAGGEPPPSPHARGRAVPRTLTPGFSGRGSVPAAPATAAAADDSHGSGEAVESSQPPAELELEVHQEQQAALASRVAELEAALYAEVKRTRDLESRLQALACKPSAKRPRLHASLPLPAALVGQQPSLGAGRSPFGCMAALPFVSGDLAVGLLQTNASRASTTFATGSFRVPAMGSAPVTLPTPIRLDSDLLRLLSFDLGESTAYYLPFAFALLYAVRSPSQRQAGASVPNLEDTRSGSHLGLHAAFVQCVADSGGPVAAKPAQIRATLGIPEITTSQIKSHLQKYRARKLSAAGSKHGRARGGADHAGRRAWRAHSGGGSSGSGVECGGAAAGSRTVAAGTSPPGGAGGSAATAGKGPAGAGAGGATLLEHQMLATRVVELEAALLREMRVSLELESKLEALGGEAQALPRKAPGSQSRPVAPQSWQLAPPAAPNSPNADRDEWSVITPFGSADVQLGFGSSPGQPQLLQPLGAVPAAASPSLLRAAALPPAPAPISLALPPAPGPSSLTLAAQAHACFPQACGAAVLASSPPPVMLPCPPMRLDSDLLRLLSFDLGEVTEPSPCLLANAAAAQ